MKSKDNIKTEHKIKNFSFRIGEYLHKQLNKHILLLKKLDNQNHSKQRWLEEAVKEKLEFEERFGDKLVQKDNFLSLKISEPLYDRIEKRIEFAKRFRVSYSLKKWLLEAVSEKLEREDEKAKELLLKLKDLNNKSTANR